MMKAGILRNDFMGTLLLCYAHRSMSRSIIMQIRQISRTFKKVLLEKSLYFSLIHSKINVIHTPLQYSTLNIHTAKFIMSTRLW